MQAQRSKFGSIVACLNRTNVGLKYDMAELIRHEGHCLNRTNVGLKYLRLGQRWDSFAKFKSH